MGLKDFVKVVLVLVLLTACGLFLYFKTQILGSPSSNFNQTTRYTLGQYSVLRTVLGLHNAGDARAEYFNGQGPIYIAWFKPDTLDLDTSELDQFATLVTKYTGRQAQVVNGGYLSDGTVPLNNLNSARVASATRVPGGGSKLYVYFVQDYSPRQDQELSTTYLDSGIVMSLNAHMNFLGSNGRSLNSYMLVSLLREFGKQIGLPEQSTDNNCVMTAQVGQNGQPWEVFGLSAPQDFCAAEQQQIAQLKAQY